MTQPVIIHNFLRVEARSWDSSSVFQTVEIFSVLALNLSFVYICKIIFNITKWHYYLCLGAQVLLKECTRTSDTVCGCKEGLACGDALCSFCITACSKGQEPSEDGK